LASEAKCPITSSPSAPANRDWWPEQINVNQLHQPSPRSNPMGEDFDYAREFQSLDLKAVIADLHV